MESTLAEVKNTFNRDKDEIIKTYSGTGAGIGQEGDQYIIVVYTNDRSQTSRDTLEWKGIPLRIKYIGNVKAQ